MSESDAEAAAAEILAAPSCAPLSRDEIAAVADLDRECNGDGFCFLWWRGVVAEDAARPRRQAAFNFIAKPTGGGQRRIVAAAAWERISATQWRLRTLFVHREYRGGGFGTSLANGTPLDSTPYEVVADVNERDTLSQKFFRGIGWHGLPLTKLDGNGTIRFRADFAGCPTLFAAAESPPPAEQKPKRKRKPKPPPPQPQGAKK